MAQAIALARAAIDGRVPSSRIPLRPPRHLWLERYSMPEMALKCPHCHTERVGFVFGGERQNVRSSLVWNTFWVCRECEEGIVVTLIRRANTGAPSKCVGNPANEGFDLLGIHPTPLEPSMPEHIPDDIASDLREATDNMSRQNWTSAGMMLRKVLQRATTALASENGLDLQGIRLGPRIATLAEYHCITPAMREWADIIRFDGNSATHDEQEVFSKDQAEQMAEFVEVFLIYALTLPIRVKTHKERAQSLT